MTMTRPQILILSGAALVSLVLAVTVATVGSQLDQARLERDDAESGLDAARDELARVKSDRDAMKTDYDTYKAQADQQLKAIEQLKAELERSRSQPTQAKESQAATP